MPRIYEFGFPEVRSIWQEFDITYTRMCRVSNYLEADLGEPLQELMVAYMTLFETIRANTSQRGKLEIRVSERFLALLESEEKKLPN
jgi:hypothetical protein